MDLVERLNDQAELMDSRHPFEDAPLLRGAADEIERLRKINDGLLAACRMGVDSLLAVAESEEAGGNTHKAMLANKWADGLAIAIARVAP